MCRSSLFESHRHPTLLEVWIEVALVKITFLFLCLPSAAVRLTVTVSPTQASERGARPSHNHHHPAALVLALVYFVLGCLLLPSQATGGDCAVRCGVEQILRTLCSVALRATPHFLRLRRGSASLRSL